MATQNVNVTFVLRRSENKLFSAIQEYITRGLCSFLFIHQGPVGFQGDAGEGGDVGPKVRLL